MPLLVVTACSGDDNDDDEPFTVEADRLVQAFRTQVRWVCVGTALVEDTEFGEKIGLSDEAVERLREFVDLMMHAETSDDRAEADIYLSSDILGAGAGNEGVLTSEAENVMRDPLGSYERNPELYGSSPALMSCINMTPFLDVPVEQWWEPDDDS